MKVAFFSKDADCRVASCMAAVCMTGILQEHMKILTLENHWSRDSIAQYLLYENSAKIIRDGRVHYLEHGMMESLVMHFANRTNKRKSDIMTIEILQDYLYYMPQNAYSKDVFDYEFYMNVIPKLYVLEKSYPYIFIDTKNNTMNTKTILQDADLVIVSLKQDLGEIQTFFREYHSLLSKSLFLISNYHPSKSCNLMQIRREFNLPKEAVLPLAYNHQYETALRYGKAINFFYDNIQTKPGSCNYTFIRDIKHIAKNIVAYRDNFCVNVEGGNECIISTARQ